MVPRQEHTSTSWKRVLYSDLPPSLAIVPENELPYSGESLEQWGQSSDPVQTFFEIWKLLAQQARSRGGNGAGLIAGYKSTRAENQILQLDLENGVMITLASISEIHLGVQHDPTQRQVEARSGRASITIGLQGIEHYVITSRLDAKLVAVALPTPVPLAAVEIKRKVLFPDEYRLLGFYALPLKARERLAQERAAGTWDGMYDSSLLTLASDERWPTWKEAIEERLKKLHEVQPDRRAAD